MPHEDYCYALERENHALNEKYESLRQQLEIERMRNVACDVVAMADTPTSAEEARKMLPDYRSAALESVIRRVDECIALRQQLASHDALNAYEALGLVEKRPVGDHYVKTRGYEWRWK